jgi:hypothetical protein
MAFFRDIASAPRAAATLPGTTPTWYSNRPKKARAGWPSVSFSSFPSRLEDPTALCPSVRLYTTPRVSLEALLCGVSSAPSTPTAVPLSSSVHHPSRLARGIIVWCFLCSFYAHRAVVDAVQHSGHSGGGSDAEDTSAACRVGDDVQAGVQQHQAVDPLCARMLTTLLSEPGSVG